MRMINVGTTLYIAQALSKNGIHKIRHVTCAAPSSIGSHQQPTGMYSNRTVGLQKVYSRDERIKRK